LVGGKRRRMTKSRSRSSRRRSRRWKVGS
jgi:hypothetical protein